MSKVIMINKKDLYEELSRAVRPLDKLAGHPDTLDILDLNERLELSRTVVNIQCEISKYINYLKSHQTDPNNR